jgi:hypothetical protein
MRICLTKTQTYKSNESIILMLANTIKTSGIDMLRIKCDGPFPFPNMILTMPGMVSGTLF